MRSLPLRYLGEALHHIAVGLNDPSSMRGDRVHEVLADWLPKKVLRGQETLDASEVVQGLPDARLETLILHLYELGDQFEALNDNIYWELPKLASGALPAYVPSGQKFETRLVYASLFADKVMAAPPLLPVWRPWVADISFDAAGLLKRRRGFSENSRQLFLRNDSSAVEAKFDSLEIEEMIDYLESDEYLDWSLDQVSRELLGNLRPLAARLLDYWWSVRDGVAEGWLTIVDGLPLNSDWIKDISRNPEFRAHLAQWRSLHPGSCDDAWRDLLTANYLAHILGRDHVFSFSASQASRDLIALTSRFYTGHPPFGGFLSDWTLPRRLSLPGGAEVERGSWFAEVMLGFGPAADLLDMEIVHEMRSDGTAAALRQWMTTDLNRAVFASEFGEDAQSVIDEAQHRLNVISRAADARITNTRSELTRRRLKQAGINGASGLIGGFAGTVVTGGNLVGAAAAAAVGFALSAGTAAATQEAEDIPGPVPVVFDLMRRMRSRKALRRT